LKAFYEKVEGDNVLQGKLKALVEKGKAQHEAAVAELVKIGSGVGYAFTADHVAEARKVAAGELSEDELKNVAGGGVGYTCTGTVMKDTCKYITWS
jgi:predicted ribosomally synthesized peptide with nif11-like leader